MLHAFLFLSILFSLIRSAITASFVMIFYKNSWDDMKCNKTLANHFCNKNRNVTNSHCSVKNYSVPKKGKSDNSTLISVEKYYKIVLQYVNVKAKLHFNVVNHFIT